jgi:FtsP/CotA-like multicopper oxidase with cupredoxin domain
MKQQMTPNRKTAPAIGASSGIGLELSRHVLVLLCLSVFPHGAFAQAGHGGRHSEARLGEASSAQTGESPEIGFGTAKIVSLNDGDSHELVARPGAGEISGTPVKMFAFNGTIPGPTFRVRQGSEIILRFRNLTDAPTTLHFHGVRLDNRFDGTPGLTQAEVEVGRTFEYRVKFPDPGVYWYHPHTREDRLQELGLYGNFIVDPRDSSYFPPVNEIVPVAIDDIALDGSGVAPFSRQVADHALMGRFGNVLLVNGLDHYHRTFSAGSVIRLYLTNAANARTFRLALPGARMKLLGGDNGRYARERFVKEVLLSPSERAIVDVFFPKAGRYAMRHRTPQQAYTLPFFVDVNGGRPEKSYQAQFWKLRQNDLGLGTKDLKKHLAAEPDKRLQLTMETAAAMMHLHHMHGGEAGMGGSGQTKSAVPPKIEWEDGMGPMNAAATSENTAWKMVDRDTGKANMDIDWHFPLGDRVKVRVWNDPNAMHPMQHPIHFHGQRFLVLATNGVPNGHLVWKDTALIQTGDTVDFLVEMSNPGAWMAHCHIAEHLQSGMMFGFRVESGHEKRREADRKNTPAPVPGAFRMAGPFRRHH